jgi:hypothetical protein
VESRVDSVQYKADCAARKGPQRKKLPTIRLVAQQIDDPPTMATHTEVTI